MKYLEAVVKETSVDTLEKIAEKYDALDFRSGLVSSDDSMQQVRMVLSDDNMQKAIDAMQNILGAQPTAKLMVMPIQAYWPKHNQEDSKTATESREGLYQEVAKNCKLDSNFIILVLLSTIVAAIGLVENNIAVIIGAMVIAPLLGPILAFCLGTTLADRSLVIKSIRTLAIGVIIAVLFSALIGFFYKFENTSSELLARTVVGLDSAILALASGAAAALSMTTGLSSVLVGVMVAVALLPPASAVGIFLGQANTTLAFGAFMLLLVNVVCLNLSCKFVFYLKGIHPRQYDEKEKARKATLFSLVFWFFSLILLLVIAYNRK